MDPLIELTKKVIQHLEDLLVIFENGEEPSKDKAFFHYVQSETKPIFLAIEEWEQLAKTALEQKRITTLHLEQITSTKDNMTALILHSYYKDVRKRRYMEINKSCHYIFQHILKEAGDSK